MMSNREEIVSLKFEYEQQLDGSLSSTRTMYLIKSDELLLQIVNADLMEQAQGGQYIFTSATGSKFWIAKY
jgi:hypothetical protein